jgi:hypothetical protein
VERAGVALACVHSTSEEFEADVIRARRAADRLGARYIGQMQVVLGATALAALAALVIVIL